MSSDPIYTPLENGLDYVLSAVDLLGKSDPSRRDLKYAVLHLQAGVEVLLKVRLLREHWTLVFKDANKADKTSFQTGSFTSVTLAESFGRLDKICALPLSRMHTAVDRLSSARNRLQHFGFTQTNESIEALLVVVLDCLLDFLRTELHTMGSDRLADAAVEEVVTRILPALAENAKFATARRESAKTQARDAGDLLTECPRCYEPCLILSDSVAGGQCTFCLTEFDHSLASEIGFVEPGIDGTSECAYCHSSSVVDVVRYDMQTQETVYVCTNCGSHMADVDQCSRCGALMEGATSEDDYDPFCRNCWDQLVDRD